MTSRPAVRPAMELYAIAPTQFDSHLRVDTSAMLRNAERLASSGTRRLLLTGSYGEFQSLTDDERVAVLEAVRRCGGPTTLMACAASTSTDATIVLALRMLDAGADTVMVSVPLACELTDADIGRHFERLATHIAGRLVVYNNPVFGIDLSPLALGQIAALDGYVAIKQGTRDLGNLLRGIDAVRAVGRDVRVLAASDLTAAASLMAGVDGLTSTNCWVFPETFPAMVTAASEGDRETLAQLDSALEPYRAVVARYGQPATVKAAMRLRGWAGTPMVRLPYTALDGDATRQVAAALEACDRRLTQVSLPAEVPA